MPESTDFVFRFVTLLHQNLSRNMTKSLKLYPFVVFDYVNEHLEILIIFCLYIGNRWKRWITRCSGMEKYHLK